MTTGPAPLTASARRVAGARRLLQRKYREREGRFLVEGPQAVREALGAGRLLEMYATPEAALRHPADLDAARAAGIPAVVITDAALAGLATSVTPQGLVGVATYDTATRADLLAGHPRLVVLLHEVRDPGNAGSVVRVADAAGADAVLFSDGSVDPANDKAVRASTGSLFHLPVLAGGASRHLIADLRAAGLRVLAADITPGAEDLDDLVDADRLAAPTAWVFGNEAHGLPTDVLDAVDAVVRIPLYGRAESLNLATAVAVCLYATARAQRRDRPAGAGRQRARP